MGRFIVFDGLDGSGKATQSELLRDKLLADGKEVTLLSFPRYDTVGATFVNLYLSGRLGDSPEDTGAYAASTFFALDRYLSYRMEWAKEYEKENAVLIANRYTTANAVHQLSKLPKEEWDTFLSWLWDFEYGKLGIPHPDDIIYLEMRPDIARTLIQSRSEKTGQKMDIHEKASDHLDRAYEAALYASEKLGWKRIACYENDQPLSREAIHRRVLDALSLD